MRPVLLTVTTALTLIAAQSAATAQIPGLTGTLIVTNKSPSTATIIDVGGGRTLATLRTGTGPHEIASNTSGKVSVVVPATGSVTTVAEGFGWPYRVLFTPDLRTVYLPDLRQEEARFVDRATWRELSRLSFTGATKVFVAGR